MGPSRVVRAPRKQANAGRSNERSANRSNGSGTADLIRFQNRVRFRFRRNPGANWNSGEDQRETRLFELAPLADQVHVGCHAYTDVLVARVVRNGHDEWPPDMAPPGPDPSSGSWSRAGSACAGGASYGRAM